MYLEGWCVKIISSVLGWEWVKLERWCDNLALWGVAAAHQPHPIVLPPLEFLDRGFAPQIAKTAVKPWLEWSAAQMHDVPFVGLGLHDASVTRFLKLEFQVSEAGQQRVLRVNLVWSFKVF
jgi:hypothetical protein